MRKWIVPLLVCAVAWVVGALVGGPVFAPHNDGPITHRTIQSREIPVTDIDAIRNSLSAWHSRLADSSLVLDSVQIMLADSTWAIVRFK